MTSCIRRYASCCRPPLLSKTDAPSVLQALEIGKETKTQNKILDELDLHVDQATVGLRNETKHAEEVNRKSQVCYMYICIIIEVIVLVILVLILFVHV